MNLASLPTVQCEILSQWYRNVITNGTGFRGNTGSRVPCYGFCVLFSFSVGAIKISSGDFATLEYRNMKHRSNLVQPFAAFALTCVMIFSRQIIDARCYGGLSAMSDHCRYGQILPVWSVSYECGNVTANHFARYDI